MAILIPEVIVQKILTIILKVIRKDFKSKSDKKKTLLFFIFGEDEAGDKVEFNGLNFFDQAVNLLVKGGTRGKKRELEATIGYNLERAESPTIHILLPNETPKNSSIGGDEGYIEHLIDEERQESIAVFTQDCTATYNLMITSDNMMEVLIVYHFLKAMFLTIKTHLELSNLQNAVFGGNDLQINEELVPPHIFHRNFNLTFDYDFHALDLFARQFGKNYIVDYKFIDPKTLDFVVD